MEDWQLDFEWLRVRHFVKDAIGSDRLPDLNQVLLLIGIQELGRVEAGYSKEDKEGLLHIAVCRLMSRDGYYAPEGRDADGWPRWRRCKEFTGDEEAREKYLLRCIIDYFQPLINESE